MVSLSLLITACSESGNAKAGTIAPAVTPTTTPSPNTSTGPISSTGATPAPAPPAELASRVQGVAPLAVFFDAINVPNVAQPPEVNGRREYADFNYTWNFNDPSSGTWATSGRSKNEADGYVAAHVFETPGTYTVTLSVKDGIKVDETHQVTVTVEDPDTVYAGKSTICVSSTSVFTGCPSGAIQLTTTVVTDISAYIAAGRRILFRRGDTWSTNDVIRLSNADNITIGAYGACATPDTRGICSNAPLINISGDSGNGLFHSHNQNDARIMDLHFVDVGGAREGAIGGNTGLDKLLYLRLKTEGFRVPFGFSHYDTGGHDQIALVDNDSSLSRVNIAYVGSERLMVLGNRLRDPNQSHVLRVWQAYKGVIAHNELSGASANSTSGRQALKLHGPREDQLIENGGSRTYRTQYVVVADNLIGDSGPWSVSIGPINTGSNEHIQDVVVENNGFYPGYGTQSTGSPDVRFGLSIWISYATVRNNIFSGEGSGDGYRGLRVVPSGVAPVPVGNRIFNNTIYKVTGALTSNQIGVSIETGSVDTEIRNNLVHFALGYSDRIAVDDNGTGTIQSNNLLTGASLLVDPDNPNFMAKDFRLDANSPAVNAGTNVPVFKDKDGTERTLGGTTDLGAYERQ